MMKRLLAAATLAASATLMLAPMASAAEPDDPYGWNAYRDRTASFISALDPAAYFDRNQNYKLLLVSPYGNSRKIECRGDGHYVTINSCRQYDTAGVAHSLQAVPTPFGRTLYLYQ